MVRIDSLARRSLACWQRGQEARRTELRAAARALPSADELLALPRQRLDHATARLPRALAPNAQIDRAKFSRIAGRHRRRGCCATHVERRRERLDSLQRCGSRPRCKTYRDTRLARHRAPARARERVRRSAPCCAIDNLLDNRDLRARARRAAADGVLLSRRAGARLCAGARPRRQSAAPGGGGRRPASASTSNSPTAACARRPRKARRRCAPVAPPPAAAATARRRR